MTFIKSLFLMTSVLALYGCQDTKEIYDDRPIEDLYKDALHRLHKGDYTKSAEAFANVERQYPYSDGALRAQLMSGFAYYQAKKYDEAIESFSVFISLHPQHAHVAYAHYMIGICYYEQVPITGRDQRPTERALEAFNTVIEEHPTSAYAKDATMKRNFLYNQLAGKEMDVGRFYQSRGNHLAAINRFKVVVEKYQTTAHTPEALHRLVESYISLGLLDQAKSMGAVLGHNYPGSSWYQESYNLLMKYVKTLPAPGPQGVSSQSSASLTGGSTGDALPASVPVAPPVF